MVKKNIMVKVLSLIALVFVLVGLTACGQGTDTAAVTTSAESTKIASNGTLILKVNPEVAVHYDDEGFVTGVTGKNKDGKKLTETYTGFEGKDARVVVNEVIAAIGEAGYFVEEIEGDPRKITIELERGSVVPTESFVVDIVSDIRDFVNGQNWEAPVEVKNGGTDYDDTDYGPNNDGVTDYDDTDYGPNNDGVTDYDDTDYGDGVTDYDTDYDSPYDDTNYDTPYDDSAYDDSPYDDTDSPYDDTDYDDSDYDDSDYDDSDYD